MGLKIHGAFGEWDENKKESLPAMRFLPYLSSPDRFYTLLEILQRMMLRARSRREKGPLKNFGAESIPSRNDNDG